MAVAVPVGGLVAGVGILGISVPGGVGVGTYQLLVGAAKTPGTVAAIITDDDLGGGVHLTVRYHV